LLGSLEEIDDLGWSGNSSGLRLSSLIRATASRNFAIAAFMALADVRDAEIKICLRKLPSAVLVAGQPTGGSVQGNDRLIVVPFFYLTDTFEDLRVGDALLGDDGRGNAEESQSNTETGKLCCHGSPPQRPAPLLTLLVCSQDPRLLIYDPFLCATIARCGDWLRRKLRCRPADGQLARATPADLPALSAVCPHASRAEFALKEELGWSALNWNRIIRLLVISW
jgi:hypothetical protein